ncbi:MAG: hypothetical protein WC511_04350 [Candidatus Pacearchaeota archaeon]|jgi:hypothetical protein
MSKKENLSIEQEECIVELYKKGKEIANARKKPLVLMFYTSGDGGGIDENDLYELETKLDEKLGEQEVSQMDVCIQTTGGDANTSYLLAQLIRKYCSSMEILIPNYAYSGGTLISLSSDKILLGDTARISPIDLQLSYNSEKIAPFALVDIEKYTDFIIDTAKKIDFESDEAKTQFITPLVGKLVEEHGTKKLGELFRMRKLTELHARILLTDYMFKNCSEKKRRIDRVIRGLTSESPAHDFDIDYNMAKKVICLNIETMDRNLYKLTRQLTSICDKAKDLGLICNFINTDRKPFFEVFMPEETQMEVKDGQKKEVTRG